MLLIGLLCLAGSVWSFLKDVNIDLLKANYIIGRVAYTDIKDIEKFSFRCTTYKSVFYFKLNNSDQNFAIHRESENYEDLLPNIKVGDTIKVFYRSSINDYNTHVFQVENKHGIVKDYKEYSKTASSKAESVFFIGIVVAIISILWYLKFDPIQFMKGLVER